jgi:hypothetical protein
MMFFCLGGQISFLFQDAASLCMTAKSIFNIERLCCVVLLMVRTQQLRLSILQSEAPVLVTVLRNTLTNEQGVVMGKLDAFRVSKFHGYMTTIVNVFSRLFAL